MIELRWLERIVPLPHDTRIGKTVRALQYRNGSFAPSGEWIWTKWQDVPTVRDDSASSEQEKK